MRVRRRIDAGCVCEIEIYTASDGRCGMRRPRLRFRDAEERRRHREKIGLRNFIRMIHANYYAGRSLYSTLTFSPENEVYYFKDAKRVRENFARRMRRAYPDAKFIIVIGRGKKNQKIHMHMISDGIPAEEIRRIWADGIVSSAPLRAHCVYDGDDHGPDWTALATYLWEHWTPEQGGHHYYATRNHRPAEKDRVRAIRRSYTAERPPRAPAGYRLVEAEETRFGYQYFKYIKMLS